MASSRAKKLVVCGGSGFLGSQICKKAVHRGWAVTSLTRTGTPPEGEKNAEWARKVEWAKADLMDPSSYAAQHLPDASAVVHSVGVLLETDYKGLARGKAGSPTEFLGSLVRAATGSARPSPAAVPGGSPYERVNTESAMRLASAVAEASRQEGPVPFAYISAAGAFPLLPAGYIASKRETERRLGLAEWAQKLHPLFFRPGFMYPPWGSSAEGSTGPSLRQLMSVPIVAGGRIASAVEDAVGGKKLSAVLGAGTTTKPLPTDEVGSAVVELFEQLLAGEGSRWAPGSVVTARDIERLAGASWRKDLA